MHNATRPNSPRLPPELAFVVQLAPGSAESPARLQGRVEHVASGEAQLFESSRELLDFLGLASGRRPGAGS